MAPTHPPAPATSGTAAPPAARKESPTISPADDPGNPTPWSAPAQPRRTLTPADQRLLRAQYEVTHYTRGNLRTWRVLGDTLHAHLLAGIRADQLAAALGISSVQVRKIRRDHSDYNPAVDPATPRQLGAWGPVGAAATAAGTTPARLKSRLPAAVAAGVTVLHGDRRLWHATATAQWWATATDPAAARAQRADQARQLHASGTPVSTIASQLGFSKATIRRDLDTRTPLAPGPG